MNSSLDIRIIFKQLAKRLLADFQASAQLYHPTNKGDIREDILRAFLENGRLPQKYGIGSGCIISPTSANQSNQCDLVIYDKNHCPILFFSDRVQVFPIEGIHGIIEVKSHLSKTELEDGLQKIKNLRIMVSQDCVSIPFGIIFAYSLKGNSLTSLEKNLKEYKSKNDPLYWPNLVVVLEEGIIFNQDKVLRRILTTEHLSQGNVTAAYSYKEDTLFEFYTNLFSLLSNSQTGQVDINRYTNPLRKIGDYLVRDGWIHINNKKYSLSEKFVKKIVKECQKTAKKSRNEIMLLCTGFPANNSIPREMMEKLESKDYYFYDPENLPSLPQRLAELHNNNKEGVSIEKLLEDLKQLSTKQKYNRTKSPFNYIEIDHEIYFFPLAYALDDEKNNLIEVE